MNRCFTNVLSEDVDASANFYQKLFGMERHFSSEWFIILTHRNMPGFELGLLLRESEIVPEDIKFPPKGVMITFVVENCEDICQKATDMGVTIIEQPKDMPYGQRRMLLKDNDGTVIDVSSPIG